MEGLLENEARHIVLPMNITPIVYIDTLNSSMRIHWIGIWCYRQSLLYYPFLLGDCGRCLDVKQKETCKYET